jgi:hypothetical protein
MPQKYPIMFPVCIDVSLIPDRMDFCSSTTLIELIDFSIHLLELAEVSDGLELDLIYYVGFGSLNFFLAGLDLDPSSFTF